MTLPPMVPPLLLPAKTSAKLPPSMVRVTSPLMLALREPPKTVSMGQALALQAMVMATSPVMSAWLLPP